VGSTVVSTNLDDNLRMIQKVVRDLAAPTTLAAAAGTTDLGSKDETFITLTGTAVTITGLGTVAAGIYKWVIFNAAHVLTHNGTSLILPTAANITAAAGDVACFVSLASGNWRCVNYMKANGNPLANVTQLSDGSVSAPALTFVSDTNTGLYSIGADSMGAAAGGILAATFNHAAGGFSLAPTTGNSALTLAATGGTSGTGTVSINAASGGGGGTPSVSLKSAGTTLLSISGTTAATNTVALTGKITSAGVACTETGGASLSVSGNAGACTVVLGASATVIVVNFNVTYASAPVVIPSYEGANITIQTAPTTTEVTFTLSAASTSGDILRFITIE
jgi:hypothetical protein